MIRPIQFDDLTKSLGVLAILHYDVGAATVSPPFYIFFVIVLNTFNQIKRIKENLNQLQMQIT